MIGQPRDLAPHSLESEQAVLGGVINDPVSLALVDPILSVTDFFAVRHAWIYQAILDVRDQGMGLDVLTIAKRLEDSKRLDDVGGKAYLYDLLNHVPTYINIETYAKLVEIAALRRRLLGASGEIAQAATQDHDTIDKVIDRAERAFYRALERKQHGGLKSTHELASQHYDRVEERIANKGNLIGIATKLQELDNLLLGLRRKSLTVIAARPGMGKTALALGWAIEAAQAGYRTTFHSLEMSDEQIMDRLASIKGGIDHAALEKGDLTSDQYNRYVKTIGELANLPLFIDDTPRIRLSSLKTNLRRQAAETGLDVVFVDYLQLMVSDTTEDNENRAAEVAAISAGLLELARELNVVLVACAQLNRGVEARADKRPELHDLKESGAIEQDAAVAIMLYRDCVYNVSADKTGAELLIRKNRFGPTGQVNIAYLGQFYRFQPKGGFTFDATQI